MLIYAVQILLNTICTGLLELICTGFNKQKGLYTDTNQEGVVMKVPLYKQLAEQLADQIRQGTDEVAEKLPSIRHLALQRKVSVSTVLMSYNLLEDWGLIEVRPKSGYYVRALASRTLSSPVIQVNKASSPNRVTTSQLVMNVMRDSSDPHFVSLGAAIPANDFPILNQLQKTFAQLVKTEKFLGIGYDSTKGNETLRKQLARRATDAGVLVSSDEIVITAGCQGAIGLCLRALCQPGDIVAVETPSYYGLLQLIESLGLKAIEIPSDPQTGMSIDALKLALEQWPIKTILSVPNFSNPMGALMPDENKQKLVQLLYEYDVPFIEDDIYGELAYSEQRPKAVKAFDTKGLVLLCSSVSKVLEPQLGLGWVMPGRYVEQIEYERFLSSSSHFRLPQLAVAEILSKGSFDRHLRVAREVYRQRRDRLTDLVCQYFPEDTRLSKPQGGFVAWLQFSDTIDSTQFYLQAKTKGVIVAPGEIFSSNPQKYKHSVRLSYASEWTKEREQALQKLGALAQEML